MVSEKSHQRFSPDLFEFLQDLSQNNQRNWFKANEGRYQEEVLKPAFAFIRTMRPRIHAISPHFVAESRKFRSSLMRVHRDVRFSKDKRPYKTNVGIRFPHESSGDISAPGFYVHLSPEEVFLGVRGMASRSTFAGKDPREDRSGSKGLAQSSRQQAVPGTIPAGGRESQNGPQRLSERPSPDRRSET